MKKFLKWTGVLALGFLVFSCILGNQLLNNASQASKPTPQATASKTEGSSSTTPSSPWSYSENHDNMRGSTDYYATVDSTNSLNFSFPYNDGAKGELTVRASKKFGKDVMLRVSKGQFVCHVDGCQFPVKFDNDPIRTYTWNEPLDGETDTLFVTNYKGFMNRLKTAKHVTIEAEFFQEGMHQIEFDVQGLDWKH